MVTSPPSPTLLLVSWGRDRCGALLLVGGTPSMMVPFVECAKLVTSLNCRPLYIIQVRLGEPQPDSDQP